MFPVSTKKKNRDKRISPKNSKNEGKREKTRFREIFSDNRKRDNKRKQEKSKENRRNGEIFQKNGNFFEKPLDKKEQVCYTV